MPSPFPGMDPYLEGDLWQEFHDTLAHQIRSQLLQNLPPKYVALLAKRYVVNRPLLSITDLPQPRVIYPDVHVAKVPGRVMEATAVYTTITPPAVEVPSPFIENLPILSVEIRDVAGRRLVTVIEILSPANKRGEGAREYGERRLELMAAQVHLLEIDLLRRGQRIELGQEPPPAPYYAYLSRMERRPLTQVWPISLRDPLPTLPVPLLPPDEDVVLELQTAVVACFALVGYQRLLDYTVPPPEPELSQEDAVWLQKTLSNISQ